MATGDALNPLLELVQLPMQAGNDTNRLRPIMLLLPIAGLARLFHWSAAIVLVVNLVAIIFLSDVISSASDELADSLGHLQGALIGATLGNTVELTVRIHRFIVRRKIKAQVTDHISTFSPVSLLFCTGTLFLLNRSWLVVYCPIFYW